MPGQQGSSPYFHLQGSHSTTESYTPKPLKVEFLIRAQSKIYISEICKLWALKESQLLFDLLWYFILLILGSEILYEVSHCKEFLRTNTT